MLLYVLFKHSANSPSVCNILPADLRSEDMSLDDFEETREDVSISLTVKLSI